MNTRPGICCRALHGQLVTPIYAIELSLAAVNSRGCYSVSTIARRHGSYVPGPLESRRRSGKRRMTHLTEAIPTYESNAALNWSLLGEPDTTRWNWQPATPRAERERLEKQKSASLSSWLFGEQKLSHVSAAEFPQALRPPFPVHEWRPEPEQSHLVSEPIDERHTLPEEGYAIDDKEDEEQIKSNMVKEQSAQEEQYVDAIFARDIARPFDLEQRIFQFEESCQSTLHMVQSERKYDVSKLRKLCSVFNDSIRKELLDNGIPKADMVPLIEQVSAILRPLSWRSEAFGAKFLSAVWDGIVSGTKVSELEAPVVTAMIRCLSTFKIQLQAQLLAQKILSSLSVTQIREQQNVIALLVEKWAFSWTRITPAMPQNALELAYAAIDKALVQSGKKLMNLQFCINRLTGNNPQLDKSSKLRVALKEAQHAYIIAESKLANCKRNHPRELSISICATALGNVPSDMLKHILLHNSNLVAAYNGWASLNYKFHWLSLVARLSAISEADFLETWKVIEQSQPEGRGAIHSSAKLILNHWASHGIVTMMERDKMNEIIEERCSSKLPGEEFSSLIYALSRRKGTGHAVPYEHMLMQLVSMLIKLGRIERIYPMFHTMNELGMKIPLWCFYQIIELVTAYEVKLAHHLYHPLKSMIRFKGKESLRLENLPNFHFALISAQYIPVARIFATFFEIPMARHRLARSRPQKPILTRRMTDLEAHHWEKVAVFIANCEDRDPRVAFHCIHSLYRHLRQNRANVTSAISKAMSHVMITRLMMVNRTMGGSKRLAHTLHVVNKIEGQEVAQQTEAIASAWIRQLAQERELEWRRTEGLHMHRPID